MATYDDSVSDSLLTSDDILEIRSANAHTIEGMSFSHVDSWKYYPRPSVIDKFKLCEVIDSILNANSHVFEPVVFKESVNIIWFELIEESMQFSGAGLFDPSYYQHISEKLRIHDSSLTVMESYLLIQDSIKLLDAVISSWGISIVQSLQINDVLTDNLAFINSIVENMSIIETSSYQLRFFTIVKDNVKFTDDLTFNQVLNNHIKEMIAFGGFFEFEGNQFTFTINTKNEAITNYDNYPFNSMSNGLGATNTGIFELTGDDDDGTLINASFRTALMEFGESLHKQIPYVYIGYTTDGKVLLKTITDSRGIKTERWYEVNQPREAEDTIRVQMGRGVKGRYWQFEINNINGSDFDFESIEFLPLTLNRRI